MALTDTHIRNAKPKARPYKVSDGGGMYLLVTPDGARYWRLDYRFGGKRRTLALGVYPTTMCPTRVFAARKREHSLRRTLTQVLQRRQPSVRQSTRMRRRLRSLRGNGSTASARNLSPDTAHRFSLDWKRTFSRKSGLGPLQISTHPSCWKPYGRSKSAAHSKPRGDCARPAVKYSATRL